MWSPFWKYISSGVCPWNAERGSRVLCSWTENRTSFSTALTVSSVFKSELLT